MVCSPKELPDNAQMHMRSRTVAADLKNVLARNYMTGELGIYGDPQQQIDTKCRSHP